jgi:hypothetical protein
MADARLQGEDVFSTRLQMSHELVVGFQRAKAFIERDGIDQGAQ